MGSSPGYDLRLKSIIFKNTYKKDLSDLEKSIEKFYNLFDFLANSPILQRWLEIILAFGNYLNGTTNRGGAYGFKLDTLSKISEIKSNDNKKTLLVYIVEYIGDNKLDELFGITTTLDQLGSCIEIFINLVSMQSINDSFKELNGRYKDVIKLSELIATVEDLEEDDKTNEFLGTFIKEAGVDVEKIDKKIKLIDDKYKEVVALFGDNPKDLPMDNIFDILTKFNKDVTVRYLLIFRQLK